MCVLLTLRPCCFSILYLRNSYLVLSPVDVASTSPPTRDGPISCSGAADHYEVDVVEIRISDGELQKIIP